MDIILFAALIFVGFLVYMIPSIVANARKNPNANAITVLNLLLGWTFLGWVISLVWAFVGESQPRRMVA